MLTTCLSNVPSEPTQACTREQDFDWVLASFREQPLQGLEQTVKAGVSLIGTARHSPVSNNMLQGL